MPTPYPVERVESVLRVLVEHENNQAETARLTGVHQSTISGWVNSTYKQLYHEIQDAYAMEVEAQIVAQMRETALEAVEGVRTGVKQAKAELDAGESKDPAKAARDLAWVAGNSVERVLQLTGRAQRVQPGSGAAEGMALVDALVSRGILKVSEPVEAEAVEDAQLGAAD